LGLGEFLTSTEGIALLGVVIAFLGWITGLFKWLWEQGKKPAPVVVKQETIRPGSDGTVTLTLEAYEARLRERGDEIAALIRDATGEERDQLIAAKSDLELRLADIDTAYAEAKTKITELEATLARFGNEIGGDRLAEARTALEAGDLSKADEIFAEVQAREEIAVQRAAEAAFGQGQIAEEHIRWADAAAHYARAAGLDPSYGALFKAREFAWRAGDHARAAGFGADLIRAAREEFGDESANLATALNEHAQTLHALGRYAEAEPLFRQALEIGAKTIGTEHPDCAAYLNNLASLLWDMGRHDEAEPLFRQALEIGEKFSGTEHPTYAIRLNNLALLLQDMGRRDEAEPLFRQALEIDAKFSGTAHPGYANHLNNLAMLLGETGRVDEARELHAQKHEIEKRTLGIEHPQTLKGAANYASLLRAHFPHNPALAELEAAFGPDIGR